MDIQVKYNFREIGKIFSSFKIETIFVENDSTKKELDEQIKLYAREYKIYENAAEIFPYQITKVIKKIS